MRDVRGLVLCVIAGAALVGCGSDEPEAAPAAPPPAATSEAPPPAPDDPEEAYVAALGDAIGRYSVEPRRAEMVNLGWQACEAIAGGRMTDQQIAAVLALNYVQQDQAPAVVSAARATLCPEL